MKFSLALMAAALLAGTATGALAAGPDLFAGGGTGYSRFDYPTDESPAGYNLFGLVTGAYNFTPVLGAQGDVVLRFEHLEFEGDVDEGIYLDGAAHLFYRDVDKFLFGAIGQLGHDTDSYNGGPTDTRDRAYLGVEFQGFFDMLTLYGQAGVLWVSFPHEDGASGYFATGEARYFVTPNVKLDVHGGVSVITPDGVTDDFSSTNLNLGIGAEYRLDNNPLSFFAKLDGFNTSTGDGDLSFDEVRILVGIKGNLGTDTLLDRDRNGASLKPVDPEFTNFNTISSGPPS